MDRIVAGIRANSVPGIFKVTNDLRVGRQFGKELAQESPLEVSLRVRWESHPLSSSWSEAFSSEVSSPRGPLPLTGTLSFQRFNIAAFTIWSRLVTVEGLSIRAKRIFLKTPDRLRGVHTACENYR